MWMQQRSARFLLSIDFRRNEAMQKLAPTVAVAAAIAIPSSLFSNAANAHGYRYHHHVWGDGDWEIIRWANGDCKIWHDDNGPPWGADWVVLRDNLPSWNAARGMLGRLQSRGRCAPS
jgi:hypothetical protein